MHQKLLNIAVWAIQPVGRKAIEMGRLRVETPKPFQAMDSKSNEESRREHPYTYIHDLIQQYKDAQAIAL